VVKGREVVNIIQTLLFTLNTILLPPEPETLP